MRYAHCSTLLVAANGRAMSSVVQICLTTDVTNTTDRKQIYGRKAQEARHHQLRVGLAVSPPDYKAFLNCQSRASVGKNLSHQITTYDHFSLA